MKSNEISDKSIILLVAGGGFLYESMCVAEMLGDQKFRFNFAVSSDITFPREKFPIGIVDIIEPLSLRASHGFFKSFKRISKSIFQSFNIVRKRKANVVVLVGSSMALPLAIFSKMYRKKVIFIETVTRTKELSGTGLIFYKLGLADRFYVQWPELEIKYVKTTFKGSII